MNWAEMTKKQKGIVIGVIIIMIALAIFGFISNGGASSSGSKTCELCHRSYSDSGNTRSIASRGMCEHCYNDYKWAKEGMEGLGQ